MTQPPPLSNPTNGSSASHQNHAVMDIRGLTALKDGMERFKATVKDSKFAPLKKRVDACLLGFPKQLNSTTAANVERKTVDEAIALACQSIANTSTDPIIRAALDMLEVTLSFELTKDSKATGAVLRSICATPRGRAADLTHKLLRNLSRCEVHHFVDVQVFELICSTIFELLNQSETSSAIDASCRAGLAHLLANRLVRYHQPRQEGETDEVVGTPDYVVSVVLMKATEIENNRADTFFEIVANLFRESPDVLVQPKSRDLVLRHVLPRCLHRPKHPTALMILGNIVSVFEDRAFPFAEIIFHCALIPALQELNTAVDAMTVFLDTARKPHVLSGLLAYYDCSGGARSSLVQEWIKAVCEASTSEVLRNIRPSLALLLQLFVDYFASLYEKEPSAENDSLVAACKEQTSKRLTALLFNEDQKKGVAQGVKTGVIRSTEPADIAQFLRASGSYLDKVKVGEFIAKRERKDILIAFIDTFDFSGVEFSDGIRMLMGVFKMVGEADIVDRTTDYYAARYVACNPGSFLQDTAAVLAFSTMMLNTDLHSPHVKVKMTLEEFVRNNRGIDDGKDLPREVLEGIYTRIKNKEIVLEGTLSNLTPQEAAARARETYGRVLEENQQEREENGDKNDDNNNVASADVATRSPQQPKLDKRISSIIFQGAISPMVRAIVELLSMTSSREASVKVVLKLIKLVCDMDFPESLTLIVKAISSICENTQYSASLRLTALTLLIDSILEHLEQFHASWPFVAKSIASCAQVGPEAASACIKLSSEIPNLSGKNLSAFVAGFIEVVAENSAFLTPDSFLWRLICDAVDFTCKQNPELWRNQMWKQSFPQLKQAIYNFPDHQCSDAIDRLCSASLVASPQCLELVLFVVRAFHATSSLKNEEVTSLTFLRTASLVDLARCDFSTDYSCLIEIYETLARRPSSSTSASQSSSSAPSSDSSSSSGGDLCLKAFHSFKSNVLDVVMSPDGDFNVDWQAKAMKVTSIFANTLISGAADQDLFTSIKTVLKNSSSSKQKSTQSLLLLCCGCMTDLIISSEVPTERRQEALAQLLSIYSSQVDLCAATSSSSTISHKKAASSIVSSILIPLFETLVDSVASLYAKIAKTRVAAQRERSLSIQRSQAQNNQSSNNNNAPTAQRQRGATTTEPKQQTSTRSSNNNNTTSNQEDLSSKNTENNLTSNSSFGTSQSLLLSKSEADFQAVSEAAIAVHVELLVRLFNKCVPLVEEDISPARRSRMESSSSSGSSSSLFDFETVFLVECLKCALRSHYECTQQVAMIAIKQLAQPRCYSLLNDEIWGKVTELIDGIIGQTSHAFKSGGTMQDLHMRFWTPLISSIHAHAANLSNPSPLVSSTQQNGRKLSASLSELLSTCANSKNRNNNMLEFEKDILKLASQIAVSSRQFDKVGDIGQIISNSLVGSALSPEFINSSNNNSPLPVANNNNNNTIQQQTHAVYTATQFVEWIAHIENMDLFVSTVKSAYPSLCDLMKCGDCSVGTALSLVFHRLAPVMMSKSV